MASGSINNNELDMVRKALLPVLGQAAIGYFDRDVEIDPTAPEDVNELLAGVQVLLEVVRERGIENDRLTSQLMQSRTPMGLLDEIMDSSGGK